VTPFANGATVLCANLAATTGFCQDSRTPMATETRQPGPRPYRKRKRALSELETRQRITEAAVALHQTVGPARTSVKAIAERAAVDRATVYRHFPDEQALFNACTGHYYARHPMPDPGHWVAITDPDERLRAALAALYSWYGETEEMLATGIRDIEHVPAESREAFLGYFQTVHAALMAGRRERGRTRRRIAGAIGHAINFHTWHSLVREQQLSVDEAITLMVATVHAAAQPAPVHSAKPEAQPPAHAHKQ
jgi:AcrR family transcriptional regulator